VSRVRYGDGSMQRAAASRLVELKASRGNSSAAASASGTEPFVGRERRRSLPEDCRGCESRGYCALSRAGWFRSIMRVKIHGRNTTLARQGQKPSEISVIRRGWVQITHIMPNGKALADLAGPGAVIGIAWAAAGLTFPYSAMALEECEVECADASLVLARLRRDAGVANDLLRYVSRQSARFLQIFYDVAAKVPSEQRLLNTLRETAKTCGIPTNKGVRIGLLLPVQFLADRVGCSRQWVSKMLASFEARGLLIRSNGWFTLVDGPTDSGDAGHAA
jgi:CRP/FNR family transcriptional regulator, cyclic AMP receptor protein